MSASASTPDNMQLAPGAIVGGKYRIDDFLGAGGMGVVLSATHLELNAPVAIKIVREELAQNEQIVSRLLFEARAAARMRSTHIVRVLDVARLESGAPYIVMEQLQGWDLQAVLAERGVLSVREAIRHILQACEGLAEAHGLGIVHRDLKPENLFLATTPEGVVLKILDFGLSKDLLPTLASGHCSTLTKDGSAVGTPYYMSPEQMRASPTLDARADIWSLGAILFELLTGSCPFEADTPARLCAKVMVEDAPSLLRFSKRAPVQLDAIVRRCLQKDPAARFQTVTDLADALRRQP
jgi:serine/threonine protein kinase